MQAFTGVKKATTNLKLWVVVVSYAAGIASGAKVLPGVLNPNACLAVGRGFLAIDTGAGASSMAGNVGRNVGAEVLLIVAFVGIIAAAMSAIYWFGAKRDPGAASAYLLIVLVFVFAGAATGARIDLAKIKQQSYGNGAANNSWVATGSTSRVSDKGKTGAPEVNAKTGVAGVGAKPSVSGFGARPGVSGVGANTAFSWVGAKAGLVVDGTRAYVRQAMEERLPADEAGLMMGVLLGDTSTVPPEVKADFKRTGLSHILAVSGLNVTILVTACAFLFTSFLVGIDTPGRLTPGRFLIFTVAAGVIVFYMALCGFAPSIVRAGVMGLAALAAPLAGRQTNVFAAMAAAAMALLIIDPATVFNVGFQLSFGATISIILFAPHITRILSATPDAPSGVAKAFAVAISAQIGVAPILAANFGNLSLITPVANAAVAPAIAPAQLLGIVIPMFNYISAPLGAITAYPAHISLAYTMAGASFFSKWPFASIGIPQPAGTVAGMSGGASAVGTATAALTTVFAIVYFIAATALYLYLKNRTPRTKFTQMFRGRVLARTLLIAGAAGVLIIAMLGYQAAIGQPPTGLRVTFMDVGQGDSTLIQAEDGATILIDGGPEADSAEAKLRAYGVQKIDLLIITHPHADHVNGLPAVVRDHQIERAIIPPDKSKNNQYLRTLEMLGANKVAETAAREGEFYKVGRDLTVKILSPDAPDTNAPDADTGGANLSAGSEAASENTNNQAVVALIQYKGIKMLFTGDIEIQTEEDIVADGDAQKIDILKVPHHGSRNGADATLMELLKPRFAIISVGAGNPYHHPAPSTIDLLRQVGATVFRTDKNGSVTIESDGKTINASAQR
jgi:competence protein ComEC